MKLLKIALAAAFIATLLPGPQVEAKTVKSKGWSNLTAEQRHKIAEQARIACRKRFGAEATVFRIDWSTGKIWCREN
jgi:hypothetical protein